MSEVLTFVYDALCREVHSQVAWLRKEGQKPENAGRRAAINARCQLVYLMEDLGTPLRVTSWHERRALAHKAIDIVNELKVRTGESATKIELTAVSQVTYHANEFIKEYGESGVS